MVMTMMSVVVVEVSSQPTADVGVEGEVGLQLHDGHVMRDTRTRQVAASVLVDNIQQRHDG